MVGERYRHPAVGSTQKQKRTLVAVSACFTVLSVVIYFHNITPYHMNSVSCHLWPMKALCSLNQYIDSFVVEQVIEFLRLANSIATPLLLLDIDWLLCVKSRLDHCLNLESKTEYLFGILQQNQFWLLQLEHLLEFQNWTVVSYPNGSVFRHGQISVAVSVIENRTSYWYLHPAPAAHVDARAFTIQGFETFRAFSAEGIGLPRPLDEYTEQWSKSRFLDCNRTSATHLRKTQPELYKTPVINDSAVTDLAYLRDRLRQHSIKTILFGGTLLGKIRVLSVAKQRVYVNRFFIL
ncbi:unnamed protein product [Soboliphyme baturini]|uniref:Nucleotid_trans domain-containing protein n=1 Tax=Soboliphyme baturini TaxID=241478 RepID=A0A183ILT3_9BILA|nr:unnamed protein product [Soboliphyme baturini]